MNIHQAEIQLAGTRHLRWLPDGVVVSDEGLLISGWALSVWDRQDRMRFLINGVEFDKLDWPLDSAYLTATFPDIPRASLSRFFAWHQRTPDRDLFPDGFARFNVTGPRGEHRLSYRTAWYLADPASEAGMPTPAQIERVIGKPDEQAYRLGGATIVKRVEQLLLERFDRPLASFQAILDWGCGAGRLCRYLTALSPAVTGIDIDPDNVAACVRLLPQARFLQVDLMPPTPFPAAAFDLVVGLSVLTHLDEPVQDAWLAELQRITRPQALLLLSVQGLAQMSLYRAPPEMALAAHEKGILDNGANAQLTEVLADQTYYRDVMHSRDYILTHWAKWFDVLDIIEGMAGNQDLVLLRRRTD